MAIRQGAIPLANKAAQLWHLGVPMAMAIRHSQTPHTVATCRSHVRLGDLAFSTHGHSRGGIRKIGFIFFFIFPPLKSIISRMFSFHLVVASG